MPTLQSNHRSNAIESRLAEARTAGTRRRAAMLSASAFTGTFALLMAVSPQSALAQCATSSAPNVVDCKTSFSSSNTSTTNPSGSRTDREYIFSTGGDVNGTVEPGVTVSGNGLAITTKSAIAGANINFNNEGSIVSSGTALSGGQGVLTQRLWRDGDLCRQWLTD